MMLAIFLTISSFTTCVSLLLPFDRLLTATQETDPTNGFVDYVSKADALSSGIARTVGSQVYLGVDNSTILSSTTGAGRNSNWLTSNKPFLHGLLIGDFAHMPGSICGLWPALYVTFCHACMIVNR